jgi:acyl-CoA synthetase (AMP-forming)/AMP-acid ligase II
MDTPSQGLQLNLLKARMFRGIPSSEFQVPYANIGELVNARVAAHQHDPWLIFYSEMTGRTALTYEEFFALVRRTANLLNSFGIKRGDRIATVAYNHPDTVVQYFAAWIIGAVIVPVNVGEDDKRIAYILNNSRSKLAFVRDEFINRVEQLREDVPGMKTIIRVGADQHPLTRETIGTSYPEFHALIASTPTTIDAFPQPGLEDEALIVYTSGTTGHPKGVVLTQYNLLIDAKAIAEWHGMAPEQRMMCVLPIHHVNGTIVTLMTPMYYGGSVVLNQKFHSNTFFDRITREQVHVVSVVPTLLQFLLHDNAPSLQGTVTGLRHIICGAGPLTSELALQFEKRFGIPIIHGYGLSETTCYSCFLPVDLAPDEHDRWTGAYGFPSIGVPLPVNEMAIHDENGNELPELARGEIVIRGHNVMKCYYENAEANEKSFTFGWFRSGDEGFYKTDPQGRRFFFITGRLKELIIRGGVNISPFEIDEVLMSIPGLRVGLSVGFENDWYGEEVGAYVQLHQGASVTEDDITSYCRSFLPHHKCPKVVIFGDEIPVTSTGKYQRNKLKHLFKRWKQVQFSGHKRGDAS